LLQSIFVFLKQILEFFNSQLDLFSGKKFISHKSYLKNLLTQKLIFSKMTQKKD
jgi:hypothetical protein